MHTAVIFPLHASYRHSPLQMQTFTPVPFMFLLSPIITIRAVSSLLSYSRNCLLLFLFVFTSFYLYVILIFKYIGPNSEWGLPFPAVSHLQLKCPLIDD